MAIERDYRQLFRVGSEANARDVAIAIKRHGHCARDAGLNIKTLHADIGIFSAGHGIFVVVIAGVFVELLERGISALVFLDGIDGHFALIVTHPSQHLAVGRKIEAAVGRKLFLVDPIGDAVEHFVELAVGSHLAFGIVEEQLHQEEVVGSDEGHHRAIGREVGHLLRTAVAQALELVVLNVEDVIHSRG